MVMPCFRGVVRRWLRIAAVGLPLALAGAVGCGGTNLYPVRGTVAFKGGAPVTPLVGGQVVFEPLDPGAKQSARGDIQPDGTFRLGTYRDGDGAPPGTYKVLVMPPPPSPSDEKRPKPRVLHPRYQRPSETPLKFTVRRGDNDCPITVERP
jgi:hypothetical protein